MKSSILKLIAEAVATINWNYVTLSRFRYGNKRRPAFRGAPHWHERPFAYEIYHRLRQRWSAERLERFCLVQAEVLKRYQEIEKMKKMPDILFHAPNTERNLAVVEIKLASNNSKPLSKDLNKLLLFQRILHYEILVEIVIGTDQALVKTKAQLIRLSKNIRATIFVILLSLTDHRTSVVKITKFRAYEIVPKSEG